MLPAVHITVVLSAPLQVGDKLKVFVLDVDKWEGQITLATSVLEQEAGDFVRLSRKEFNDRAEEPAAALRERWRSSEAMQKVFAEYPVGDLQLDMR
jgi:predicted RNA-binding protein with RPS1 domain